MHQVYGIRCEYHVHESYFGEQEYKLGKIFVITMENELYLLRRLFFTTNLPAVRQGHEDTKVYASHFFFLMSNRSVGVYPTPRSRRAARP